jgi:hypothetical protein
MINIDNKFDFEQIVYLKTDREQLPRMVTKISITKVDIIYELSCGTLVSGHYGCEISEVINELITL